MSKTNIIDAAADGPGGGTLYAEEINYSPAAVANWPGGVDPGSARDALDLVARYSSDVDFFNGTFLEPFDALLTSDGATITMTLEQSGTGDLTMRFSDGHTVLDTTPAATIALTAGTDASPQLNYIYIPQDTKVLTKSTSDWSSTEHIRVALFFVQSAALVNTQAAGNNWNLINHNLNDPAMDTNSSGHLAHIANRIRREGAKWLSGCLGTATQDNNDLWLDVAAGVVNQMHPHTFAALNSDTDLAGDPIVVVNDPDAAYTIINSLNSITKVSDGTLIGNNKYFVPVLWGVVNKSGEVSPMMLTLPDGQYNTAADAEADVDGHTNTSIPREFNLDSSTGFLIAAFVCKHTAAAMEIQSTIDLRGTPPQTTGLGGFTPGGGDVTAAAVLTDNAIVRGDGGAKGVQTSGVLIDDSDNVTGIADLTLGKGTDTDVVINFSANTNSGVLTWFEDEDYFRFNDDVVMLLAERIWFRSAVNQSIWSSAGSTLDLDAGTTMQFNIATALEMTLTANTLTFNNGAVDTGLDWTTSAQLKFQIAGVNRLTLTSLALTVSGDLIVNSAQIATVSSGSAGKLTLINSTGTPGTGGAATLGQISAGGKEVGPTGGTAQTHWIAFMDGTTRRWWPAWT